VEAARSKEDFFGKGCGRERADNAVASGEAAFIRPDGLASHEYITIYSILYDMTVGNNAIKLFSACIVYERFTGKIEARAVDFISE
jgi:hypothetical protein